MKKIDTEWKPKSPLGDGLNIYDKRNFPLKYLIKMIKKIYNKILGKDE